MFRATKAQPHPRRIQRYCLYLLLSSVFITSLKCFAIDGNDKLWLFSDMMRSDPMHGERRSGLWGMMGMTDSYRHHSGDPEY